MAIIKSLNNSKYGKFRLLVDELTLKYPDTFGIENPIFVDYPLQPVLVIGNESVGKSSILENIIGYRIFPRNSTICTKMPIHYSFKRGQPSCRLKYCNPDIGIDCDMTIEDIGKIYSEIDVIMKQLSANISEHEIHVEIVDLHLPNFNFYDLPGIRDYPEADSKLSVSMITRYLNKDLDSTILCVVPSSTPNLESCRSIGLVKEAGLERKCVVVLTMIDKLHEDIIEPLLFERICRRADKTHSLHLFADVIGVINRLHTDKVSLIDNHNVEQKWTDNIIKLLPTKYQSYVPISSSVYHGTSLERLLNRMVYMYEGYVAREWKPLIDKVLKDKIADINIHIKDIGVVSYSSSDVMRYCNSFIKILHSVFAKLNKRSNFDLDKAYYYCTSDVKQALDIKMNTNNLVNGEINHAYQNIVDYVLEYFDSHIVSYNMHKFSKIKLDIIESFRSYDILIRSKYVNQFRKIINSYLDMCIIQGVSVEEDYVIKQIKFLVEIYIADLFECQLLIDTEYQQDKSYDDVYKLHTDEVDILNEYLEKVSRVIY